MNFILMFLRRTNYCKVYTFKFIQIKRGLHYYVQLKSQM